MGAQAESGVTRNRVCGSGNTVMVNDLGTPPQLIPPFENDGVTVIVATIGTTVELLAVKAGMVPTPERGSPIAELEFVQEYVMEPPEAGEVKLIGVVLFPSQYCRLGNGFTVGLGLTIMVKTFGCP